MSCPHINAGPWSFLSLLVDSIDRERSFLVNERAIYWALRRKGQDQRSLPFCRSPFRSRAF